MNWTLNALIVRSPERDRLLLSQSQVAGYHHRVIMVDLATGHVIMKSKNGEAELGWVPQSLIAAPDEKTHSAATRPSAEPEER
jgi:hypothetical protein